MSPPSKPSPNGRNPRRRKNKANRRPNPPTRLKPCGQLFDIEGTKPHDYMKKWEKVLAEYGMTREDGLPSTLVDDLSAIIDLSLQALDRYLRENHPRHADLLEQDAYALFFPLISEAVVSAGCSGFSHKTEEIVELEHDLAMAEFKSRNID